MNTIYNGTESVAPHGYSVAAERFRKTKFRRVTGTGLALTSFCSALILSAPPAIAQPSPVMHWGSDTRAKSQPQCMDDAEFAIRETGLRVSFTGSPNVAGDGVLNGAGVSVLVTCLAMGPRTFIREQ